MEHRVAVLLGVGDPYHRVHAREELVNPRAMLRRGGVDIGQVEDRDIRECVVAVISHLADVEPREKRSGLLPCAFGDPRDRRIRRGTARARRAHDSARERVEEARFADSGAPDQSENVRGSLEAEPLPRVVEDAPGAVEALQKIVAALRKRCPKAQIIVRADSGFCREEIMAWCEAQQPKVYYCLGLARNSRLRDLLDDKFARVREMAILCGGVARGFTEFQYQTKKSWTLSRRVIGKAEVLGDKDNPRFIVTNLAVEGFAYDQQQSPDRFCAQKCYEDFYCARGNMENQIKQQYLDLDADRTSTHWMASNQLRLWFSAFALLLFQRLRALALHGTELANATAGTIRQRLLKIGAMVTVSTRRVYIRLASAFPLQNVFAQAHRALAELATEEG